MAGLFLDKRYITDSTSISNYFIDEYMPVANGEFVKIYLHLLRSAASSDSNMSISTIADAFNNTERDVMRALRYWENLGLLTLSKDTDSNITGIRLEPCKKKRTGIVIPFSTSVSGDERGAAYSADMSDGCISGEDVSQMFYIVQMYLGRPLGNEETNTLLYIVNQLGFSTDLVEYLVEHCVSEDRKSVSAIEKTAAEWAENNIASVKEAKRFVAMSGGKFYPVLQAFEITGQAIAKYQRDYILKWSETYGFSMDIIVEACARTVQTIAEPNFNYADSILERWHKNGVHTLSDIKKLDAAFEKQKTSNKRNHSGQTAPACTTRNKANDSKPLNSFHRFSQRTYDFEKLEKQLISHKL